MMLSFFLYTYTFANVFEANAFTSAFNATLYEKLASRWSYVLEDHFQPFVKNGVTSRLFDQTLEGGSHVVFQHLNGSLMISDPHGYCFCNKTHYSPNIKFSFHLRRCRAMASILLELTKITEVTTQGLGVPVINNMYRLPDYEFVWSLDDIPSWAIKPKAQSLRHNQDSFPGFGAVRCWNKGSLSMPFFGSHLDFKFSDIDNNHNNNMHHRQTHLNHRQGKAVFRGGLDRGCSFERDTMVDFNGDIVFNHRPEKDHCGRALLLEQAKKYPDLINYGGNNDTWMSLDEQESNYRYVLSVEGFGGWTDRLYELLRRSMVVFDQDHPCDQWFEPVLKPYVHYIPIANDFRNLPGRVAWANNHPNLVEEMRNTAYQWSREYLSSTGILSFMWASLNHYTRLVKYRPIARPSSVPVTRLWDQNYMQKKC